MAREDLRKWFLSMECALFRYRFRFLTPEAQVKPVFTTCTLHFKLGTNLSCILPMSAQRAVMDNFDLTCRAVNNVEFEVFTCHLLYWYLFIVNVSIK